MFDDLFGTSVHAAVQTSMAQNKPLVAFLTNELEISTEFAAKFLRGAVVERLRHHFVCIKLVEGSVEFGYFHQIFADVEVPSLYFVERGALLEVVKYENSPREFERRVEEMLRRQDRQQQAPEAQGSGGAARPSQVSLAPLAPLEPRAEGLTPVAAAAATEPPLPAALLQAPLPAALLRAPLPAALSQLPGPLAAPAAPGVPTSVQLHQLRVRQAKQAATAERSRIRALLDADERERRSLRREQAAASGLPDGPTESDAPDASPGSPPGGAPVPCALSIKLFDGSSLKHTFSAEQTLSDVRDWLDRETDNSIIPNTTLLMPVFASPSTAQPTHYVFYRPVIPRTTYTEAQERQPLGELELCPRSALILKPIYRGPEHTGPAKTGGVLRAVALRVGRVANAMYSFFEYGVEQYDEEPVGRVVSHEEEEPAPDAPDAAGAADDRVSASGNYFSELMQPPVLRTASLINIQPTAPAARADPVSRSGTPHQRIKRLASASSASVNQPEDDDDVAYNGNSLGLKEKDE